MNTSAIIFVFTLLIHINFGKDENSEHLKLIESHMNTSVDPCVDFYQYACGNYGHDADEKSSISDIMGNHTVTAFIEIFNDLNNSTNPIEYHFVENTLAYYNSCLSAEQFDPMKILDWLHTQENLSWPPVVPLESEEDSSEEQKSQSAEGLFPTLPAWKEMLAILRKYGLNDVFFNEQGAHKAHMIFTPPNKLDFFAEKSLNYTTSIMHYFGIKNQRHIQRLRTQFVNFEEKLKRLTVSKKKIELSPLHIGTLTYRTKADWLSSYLSNILGSEYHMNLIIGLVNMPYFEALPNLLNDYDDEFLRRYIMLRFVMHLEENFLKEFHNVSCVANTLSVFQLSMNWLFEKYNPHLAEEETNIETIFTNVLHNFKNVLKENHNNLSYIDLINLRYKADAMLLKVGNLPRPSTAEKLEEFYKALNSTSKLFYENYLRALSFHLQTEYTRLNSELPHNESFYNLEPVGQYKGISPYYLNNYNVIVIPLTFLWPPVYHSHFHDLFKYSAFGSILSHELTHGFDQNGLTRLNSIAASERLLRNLECLSWKGPELSGEITCDLTGLILAYQAYFETRSNQNTEEDGKKVMLLHSSAISDERLFFLNYAQPFCNKLDDSAFKDDEHPPLRARVLTALSNFDAFSRAYDCPLGSPMNPDKKCQIWHNT